MYALFKTSPGDKVTYMIYEQSQTNPNHLDYFKFVGRVIAKAIYDNKHLECYFTRSFYKHILAKAVKYTDMESEDYAFYKGLDFMMQNKVEDLGYDLTFSTGNFTMWNDLVIGQIFIEYNRTPPELPQNTPEHPQNSLEYFKKTQKLPKTS